MSARQRASKAKQELEITQDAFNSLHADLTQATFAAENAEDAYRGVLAVQALKQVRMRMEAELDAALIEEEAEEYAD